MKKIYIGIVLMLMVNLSANAESNFSYSPQIPPNQNLYQNTSNNSKNFGLKTDNDTEYHYISSTPKDDGEKYNHRDSKISQFSPTNTTDKTLTNAHNNLAERNNKLEAKVEKLDKKVKELEHKIYML